MDGMVSVMVWSMHILAMRLCVVDSAHAGSVVVCGGHGVQWMVWSMHILAMRLCVVDSACGGSVVVCGGHRVVCT